MSKEFLVQIGIAFVVQGVPDHETAAKEAEQLVRERLGRPTHFDFDLGVQLVKPAVTMDRDLAYVKPPGESSRAPKPQGVQNGKPETESATAL